jgi:hypothetical protein
VPTNLFYDEICWTKLSFLHSESEFAWKVPLGLKISKFRVSLIFRLQKCCIKLQSNLFYGDIICWTENWIIFFFLNNVFCPERFIKHEKSKFCFFPWKVIKCEKSSIFFPSVTCRRRRCWQIFVPHLQPRSRELKFWLPESFSSTLCPAYSEF